MRLWIGLLIRSSEGFGYSIISAFAEVITFFKDIFEGNLYFGPLTQVNSLK